MSNLIDDVIRIEQEAHNIVKEARSNSDSKIAAAYAESRSRIADAEDQALTIKYYAEASDPRKMRSPDSENPEWKDELNRQAKANFDQAVQEVLDRSLEYVSS